MKKLIGILILILSLSSCSKKESDFDNNPKKVEISGKVLNFKNQRPDIRISINRIGFKQEQITIPLDNQGNFTVSFESYIPTDVWIVYKEKFLVSTHPGDSIYLEFDGLLNEKAEILKTVKFEGSNVNTNRDLVTFQSLYFSQPQNLNDSIEEIMKESDVNEFYGYLDKIRLNSKTILEKFIIDFQPNEETRAWTSLFIKNHIYSLIAFYPLFHQYANNMEYGDYDDNLPNDYYLPILDEAPIEKSDFVCGHAVSTYLSYFIGAYRKDKGLYVRKLDASVNTHFRNSLDSSIVHSLLNCSSDSLFTQLVLTKLFSDRIDMESDIDFFETYMDIIEKYIKEPFLRKPLFDLYLKNKERLENQQSVSGIVNKEITNLQGKQILDSIIQINRGKVIYLDCWATWCGPCKAEMPNSKALMEELKDTDVAFAFLCLHSEKEDWQKEINKLNIGGQHYFLHKDQSIEFAKFYAINGVPNYMLIDKAGNIVDQGTHLRANIVKTEIEKLLKNI